jgi:hypothetical protein
VVTSTLAVSGCVFPRFELSGAELSWFVAESNEVDGEEGRRVRSCDGAIVTNVDFSITDEDDDTRSKTFGWTCEEGFRTPAQFFTGASDIFVDLSPGNYRMQVTSADNPAARGTPGEVIEVSQETDDVAIGSDGATLLQWELHPIPLDLELELAGTDSCVQLKAVLAYADPVSTLPDLPDEDAASEDPVPYRLALASQGGLALGGLETACADLEDGVDVVPGVDRGTYSLELQVDDAEVCAIEVVVDGRQQGPLVLDLADLPC